MKDIFIYIAIFLIGAYMVQLNERGFCFSKFSYLDELYTEQEIIDKAIAYEINHMPGAISGPNGEEIKIIRYQSVEEFNEEKSKLLHFNKTVA